MTWWRHATNHYLRQCWSSSMSPYGVTRPQWVNALWYFTWSQQSLCMTSSCGQNIHRIKRLTMTRKSMGNSSKQNQCWFIVNWTIKNKLQWDFPWNLIDANVFEKVVCKMVSILFWSHLVKSPGPMCATTTGNWHYGDVIMGAIASQITSLTIVYSTVYSDADRRKHQSSASLSFVWEFTGDRWIPRTNGQ